MLARGREAAGRQLAGHRADVLAVGLFVVGAIFALGLWTDLAGPVGSGLADGAGAVLGRARVAVPVACFAFGVLLLWPRRAPAADPDAETAEVEDGPAERPTVRIAIGALLLFVADVGILHLADGRPSLSGPIDELRDAGGALGAMIATPSIAATGVVGASVILGGVALVGLLLALGISIGMIVSAATSRSRTVAAKARSRGAAVAGRREPRRRRRSAAHPERAGTVRLRRLRGRGTRAGEPEPEPPGADAEPLPAVSARRHRDPHQRGPERAARHRAGRRSGGQARPVEAAAGQPPEAGERQGGRPPPHRRGRPHPRGHPRRTTASRRAWSA